MKLAYNVSRWTNGNHHRVVAKKVSKVERGLPATSVHGFVSRVVLGSLSEHELHPRVPQSQHCNLNLS